MREDQRAKIKQFEEKNFPKVITEEFMGDTLKAARQGERWPFTYYAYADHEGAVTATAVSHHPKLVMAALRRKLRKARKKHG